MSWVTSCRLPPVSVAASGMPPASVITWCFEPVRARSTGLGPVLAPLLAPAHATRRPPPAPSRSPRPPAAGPAAPHAAAATPQPDASPAAAASRSSPTRNPAPAARTPTGCRCTARTRSRTAPCDHPAAAGPGAGTGARPSAAAARSAPTARLRPPTACAEPYQPPARRPPVQHQQTIELTLWGPGVRPDPFPAQPGELSFRVSTSSGRRPGDVCLRRDRRASQALSGGGDQPGRAGPGESECAQRGGADLEGDRRLAAGDPGRVRGRLRHQLAGGAAGGLRVCAAPGAPIAVQGDRLGEAEERQGRRRDLGTVAAGGPAAGGMDRPGAGAPAAGAAAAPGGAGAAADPAAQPDPCHRGRLRL